MPALLNPQGPIASSELGLLVNSTLLMLIVIVPVFALLFFFAYWYRAGNKKAKYMPEWEHAKVDELIWWAIPFEIILILGALTWSSTHELDPRKALSDEKPLVVEVVALDYRWLFIYPEQKIATVNYIRIPVGKPVRFDVTADAPMNSFWIPQLGGQIYAMTGMVNSLNLEATQAGTYAGSSANYSGEGFAKMKFIAEASPQEDFDRWVIETKSSSLYLTQDLYDLLREPSKDSSVVYYSEVENNLYNTIVNRY
jgi:cytochrome o ubiquinol oxidase subunit 2